MTEKQENTVLAVALALLVLYVAREAFASMVRVAGLP